MTAIPPPLPHDPRERPAFSWRGLLVDSAHTFWPVPAMELFLSLMARYRFNVLHWRLTDDRGWRMPVPGFPRLTSVGAQLPRTMRSAGDAAPSADDVAPARRAQAFARHGFYSDSNIRHLVSYAADRMIRIVPEVCIPSGAGAAIRSYPHLGNPHLVRCGDTRNATSLWPSTSSLSFVQAALHRACDLFPSPFIHIGAGPCDWGEWEADSALMRAGFPLGSDVERVFVERALRTLRFHGRRAAAWESLTRSFPTPPDGTALLSRGESAATIDAAAAAGGCWVLADERLLAPSMSAAPATAARAIGDARRLYERLPEAMRARGLAGCEVVARPATTASPEKLMTQLVPQLLVAAEIAWHGDQALTWERLAPLIEANAAYLERAIPRWFAQRT